MPSVSCAMALGWSPAGSKSETRRNGGIGPVYEGPPTARRRQVGRRPCPSVRRESGRMSMRHSSGACSNVASSNVMTPATSSPPERDLHRPVDVGLVEEGDHVLALDRCRPEVDDRARPVGGSDGLHDPIGVRGRGGPEVGALDAGHDRARDDHHRQHGGNGPSVLADQPQQAHQHQRSTHRRQVAEPVPRPDGRVVVDDEGHRPSTMTAIPAQHQPLRRTDGRRVDDRATREQHDPRAHDTEREHHGGERSRAEHPPRRSGPASTFRYAP